MQCSSCSTQLPMGAPYCPTCGALTPYKISESGVTPNELTAASSFSGAPLQAPSVTNYGPSPYGMPSQYPYDPLNPYAVPLQTPPPVPPKRRIWRVLIGTMVFVVIMASLGVAFAIQHQRGLSSSAAPTVITTNTPTPQEIYRQATSGSPVLNDSLTGPGSGWDAGTKAIKYGCLFTAGAYHVIMQQQGHFVGCFAETTNFSNFAFQVEMTILKGEGGGLLFRAGGTNTFGYRFFFGRGNYDLNYGNTSLLVDTSHQANLNQTYLLTVIARGTSISLYIDKQWLGSTQDSSASSGKIGLLAYDQTNPTEVMFRNAQVWNLG